MEACPGPNWVDGIVIDPGSLRFIDEDDEPLLDIIAAGTAEALGWLECGYNERLSLPESRELSGGYELLGDR